MLHLFHGKFLLSHSLCQGFVVLLFYMLPLPSPKTLLKYGHFFVAAICGMLLRKHSSHVFSGGSIFSSVFYGCIPWVVCSALSSVLFGSLYKFSRFSQGHPFYALYDSQRLWCCCEYISCSSTLPPHFLTRAVMLLSDSGIIRVFLLLLCRVCCLAMECIWLLALRFIIGLLTFFCFFFIFINTQPTTQHHPSIASKAMFR